MAMIVEDYAPVHGNDIRIPFEYYAPVHGNDIRIPFEDYAPVHGNDIAKYIIILGTTAHGARGLLAVNCPKDLVTITASTNDVCPAFALQVHPMNSSSTAEMRLVREWELPTTMDGGQPHVLKVHPMNSSSTAEMRLVREWELPTTMDGGQPHVLKVFYAPYSSGPRYRLRQDSP